MSDATYTPSAAEVKALRDTTQAGMMDCKRALAEAGGDMDAAVKLLREKGIASASKRSGRGTGEGLIETYVHAGGRIGSMVEIGCETDFVARTDDFRGFCRKVALQIAAARDLRFVSESDIPEDFKAAELEIFQAKAAAEGKPEAMLEKIAAGMWTKSLTDYVLATSRRSGPRTTARRSRRCGPSSPGRSARTSRSSASHDSRWAPGERVSQDPFEALG